MNIRTIAAATFGVVMLSALGDNARAAEVRVLGSNAVKTVLSVLGPQFEKATGNKVVLVFGTGVQLNTEIDKGTPFDVAVLSTGDLDALPRKARSRRARKAPWRARAWGLQSSAAHPSLTSARRRRSSVPC